MSFAIRNNLQNLSQVSQMKKNQEEMNRTLEHLSSGRRILSAMEDPAGIAQSSRFRAEINSLDAAYRNTSQAQGMLQTAEGGMEQMESMLVRLQELSVQAASGIQSSSRDAINDEASQILSEIDRIAGSTQFGGESLLAGGFETEIQVGDGSGEDSRLGVSLPDLTTASLSGGGGLVVDMTSKEGALASMEKISQAIDQLASARSDLGATSNRLGYAQSNLIVAMENKTAAESVIADADMATEMSEFARTSILQDAQTAMLAQANLSAESVARLLK